MAPRSSTGWVELNCTRRWPPFRGSAALVCRASTSRATAVRRTHEAIPVLMARSHVFIFIPFVAWATAARLLSLWVEYARPCLGAALQLPRTPPILLGAARRSAAPAV